MASLPIKEAHLQFIYIVLLLTSSIIPQVIASCNRIPDGTGAPKSPPDGRFRIKIVGNPMKYTPNETYLVSIAGMRANSKTTHPFTGFMLAVGRSNLDPENSEHGAGSFFIMDDTVTRISDKCPNVVTQTTIAQKSEINVYWKAPAQGTGCVWFKATVIEHRDVWYMDDGMLSKEFCEDEQDSFDVLASPVEPCCACDEAKYELIFEGAWSRHTHPKDFPSNNWLTKFSDIIGASHTADYRFWEYGKLASEGVQDVAEHGATRKLESELKGQSEYIRTIIKARGTSYPNITAKTFAVFRVDSNNHLASFISKIDPSPDWIVGVSGVNLCLPNCSWIEKKQQNLYPWDVGTNSGPSYISPHSPTVPPDVIRRIRSNFPNDIRSPFYDESGMEMNPLAKIYLTRQRLYERTCESSSSKEPAETGAPACKTSDWTEWSECSVKCGSGKRTRQRYYVNQALADQMSCTKKLTQRQDCTGLNLNCDEENELDVPTTGNQFRADLTPECALTGWTSFSSCTAQCGKGVRTRSRGYVNVRAKKRCESGAAFKPMLEENQPCFAEDCGGDIPKPEDNPDCRMTQWSIWSPCSVSCGNGTQERTRHSKPRKNVQNPDPDYDPCEFMETKEVVTCDRGSCDVPHTPDYCFFHPEPGHCRDTIHRWFYDRNIQDCSVFSYGGCAGNKNNFNSREKCLETCNAANSFGDIPIENLIRYDGYAQPKVDCQLSDWIYGPCNATCGEGWRVKIRRVVKSPENGGKICPKKMVRAEKCRVICEADFRGHRRRSKRHHRSPRSNRFESDGCHVSQWSEWTECNSVCGEGVQTRTRSVLNSKKSSHNNNCTGRILVQQKTCQNLSCK